MTRLLFLFLFSISQQCGLSQIVPYGDNLKAGKYITVSDTKLYYEVYGTGRPLLLLHGDTFGYISEFDQYIPLLAKYFKVIVPALRDHPLYAG